MKKLTYWVKKNPIPAAFIAAGLIVALLIGAGLTYLQKEYFGFEPQWTLRERTETVGVTYHHTGVSDRPIDAHHDWHVSGRGWNMIGYHYHIRRDGTIEVGRPHWTVGAHAGEKGNPVTIGVALSGDMSQYPPTQAQYEAAVELHYWLETEQGYGELEVFGHKDWMRTDCPGRYTDLDIIREGVEAKRIEALDPAGEREAIEVETLKGYVLGKGMNGFLVVEEGRVYVPIRFVSEELGYDVSWDGENRIWRVDN